MPEVTAETKEKQKGSLPLKLAISSLTILYNGFRVIALWQIVTLLPGLLSIPVLFEATEIEVAEFVYKALIKVGIMILAIFCAWIVKKAKIYVALNCGA